MNGLGIVFATLTIGSFALATLRTLSRAGARVRYQDGLYFLAVRTPGEWNEIRNFVQPDIPNLAGICHDEWACLDWVCRNISYRGEFGEFWQLPSETLDRGQGDCEDASILLCSLIRRFRSAYVVLGNYQGWGHAWVASEEGEILEATYTEARAVPDPEDYCPYVYFSDREVIELWPGALTEVFQLRRDEAAKLDLMAQASQALTSNPGYIPGAKVPGGRYAELPKACVCATPGCGYRIEQPGEHCALLQCPSCGARLWREK